MNGVKKKPRNGRESLPALHQAVGLVSRSLWIQKTKTPPKPHDPFQKFGLGSEQSVLKRRKKTG